MTESEHIAPRFAAGGRADSIDREMAYEQQARTAFERKYRRDSRDPAAVADFDLFLEGFVAAGVKGRELPDKFLTEAEKAGVTHLRMPPGVGGRSNG